MFIHRLSLLPPVLVHNLYTYSSVWNSHPSFVAVVRFCLDNIYCENPTGDREILENPTVEDGWEKLWTISFTFWRKKKTLLIWLIGATSSSKILPFFPQTPRLCLSLSFSPTPPTSLCFFFRSKLHLETTEHACSYFVFLGTVLFLSPISFQTSYTWQVLRMIPIFYLIF